MCKRTEHIPHKDNLQMANKDLLSVLHQSLGKCKLKTQWDTTTNALKWQNLKGWQSPVFVRLQNNCTKHHWWDEIEWTLRKFATKLNFTYPVTQIPALIIYHPK